ncbi:MAG TPA: DUF222 domain-containing protein [Phototrophicaceae bacterium]|nr:DUF222 domain-containing protein [Phototrophicaceae bacterium]
MTPQSTPLPCRLLDGVQRDVSALRHSAPGTEAREWPAEVRGKVIAGLDALIQELTVYRGHILLAHREDGHWGSVGDRDFADYRSRETGVGRGPAIGELQLAEGLEQMPAVAGAVDRGELNLEHAKTLTRLRRGASSEVQQAMDAGALDQLVEHAAREKLTAPELGKQARAWAAKIDAEAAQADFDAVRRRRSLTMRRHAGGVKGEFFLDPVAGEELRIALDAISGRPAADDDRTREQRHADALGTLAGRALMVGSDLTGAQVRPHVSLHVSEETWVHLMAWRRISEGCPDRPPLPDVAPAELEDGTVVPLRELERLLCDSEVTRMVMSADGVPLDVGCTQRTYTKELRRAVTGRDRHCQWPDCRLRASWCEVHHITWFSRGGATSVEEGLTACSFHHHRIHEHNVQITVLPDGFDFHMPDGAHIGTTRRGTEPELRLPDPRAVPEPAARIGERPPESSGTPCAEEPRSRSAPRTEESRSRSAPCSQEPRPLPPPAPVRVLPPPPPSKLAGPSVATREEPLPVYPSTYATAPPNWDPDPPF